MNKTRSWIIRIAVIVILIAIAACMMVIGRGHTVYFDSKKLEYNGTEYDTPYKIVVFINGEQVAKLYDGERGMATWIGQNLKFDIELTQEKGGTETTQHYSVKLPYDLDGIVINLTGLMAGLPQDAYIEEFVSAVVVEDDADDEIITDEFDIGAEF